MCKAKLAFCAITMVLYCIFYQENNTKTVLTYFWEKFQWSPWSCHWRTKHRAIDVRSIAIGYIGHFFEESYFVTPFSIGAHNIDHSYYWLTTFLQWYSGLSLIFWYFCANESPLCTMVWRDVISQTELAYLPYRLDIIMKNCDIFKQFRQNFT